MFSIYVILLWLLLAVIKPTRKMAIALLPWLIFACCYDWMRLYPNYKVNPIDVKDLFDAEKMLFGIRSTNGELIIPSQYFALHHSTLLDILAGFFYLCWIPVPLGFAIYLYLKGNKKGYIQFSITFLFVNLLGFCGYYIHPAAPPWYALQYGFEPILNTPGNTAGLERFDQLTGIGIFKMLYGKNANVFAAVPSLHAAYMLITTIYAFITKQNKITCISFAFICAGIWFTAVYSSHHYIIDVLLGIAVTLLGVALWSLFINRTAIGKNFITRYIDNI